MAHLNTVEPSEQVVEDDHVAVDGEEREETCDWNQEENATWGLQARAAESHEKVVRCREDAIHWVQTQRNRAAHCVGRAVVKHELAVKGSET